MPQILNVGAPSRLVTATAWAFILLAVGAALGLLLPRGVALWPSATAQLAGHLPWLLAAAAALLVVMLASAIGLLVRLDWARRSFIALLAVAIVAALAVASTALWMPGQPLPVKGLWAALLLCIAFGGIMRGLMSPRVRQEFA